MIELKNVCYAYGKEIALRYINLNIQKGESVIIQGPNGCGKSTLIKLLNGIIFPMEGSYTYQGHEITEKTLKDTRFAKWFHQQKGNHDVDDGTADGDIPPFAKKTVCCEKRKTGILIDMNI